MAQIDVMMPAYNAAGTIGAAIASLQRQTHTDLRIIVVDDGSSDGTAAVLDEIAREDGRVVVLRQENQGIVGARNTALAATGSAYVTQLDADDLSEPDRVGRLAAHLDAHPGCVGVSGAARHIDRDGRPMGTFARFGLPAEADSAWVPAREPLVMPFSMWRRSALERVDGYRPTGLASDINLAWRLLALGDVTNLDHLVGSYRVHDSATGTSIENGRVQAVCSQLIAVSARRRERGLVDIEFTTDWNWIARLRAAESRGRMLAVAGTTAELSGEEILFMEVAVAAKMLQWFEWRRFLPESEDVVFIRRAYALTGRLQRSNQKELKRLYTVAAARLLRAKHLRNAATLTPPRFTGSALARTVLGRC